MDDLISRREAIDRINKQREHLQPDIYPQDKIGDTAYRICAEFIARLPSAQPEPQWIPCSERLPERADNVIICYKAGDYTLVSTGRYLHKFKMWYVDVVGDLRDGVTAWMPLPEPYRGGEK